MGFRLDLAGHIRLVARGAGHTAMATTTSCSRRPCMKPQASLRRMQHCCGSLHVGCGLDGSQDRSPMRGAQPVDEAIIII